MSKGEALLVGIPKFQDKKLKKIPEVVKDVQNLKKSLENLGFNCTSLQTDVTVDSFEVALQKVMKDVIGTRRKYLVVSITSHGHERVDSAPNEDSKRKQYIDFNDGELTIQSILDHMKEKELKDVLKLLIISACRSRPDAESVFDDIDQGVKMQICEESDDRDAGLNRCCGQYGRCVILGNSKHKSGSLVDTAEQENVDITNSEKQKDGVIPDRVYPVSVNLPLNCVLWYASPSGKNAIINECKGSYFIHEISSKLDEIQTSEQRDITDIKCDVHHSMATMENEYVPVKTKDGAEVSVNWKNVPCFMHTLSKSFAFVKA